MTYHIIVPHKNDFFRITLKKLNNPLKIKLNTLTDDFPILKNHNEIIYDQFVSIKIIKT